jgi:hypothetical protein
VGKMADAVELAMSGEDVARLTTISRSRKERGSRVERAQKLLMYRIRIIGAGDDRWARPYPGRRASVGTVSVAYELGFIRGLRIAPCSTRLSST